MKSSSCLLVLLLATAIACGDDHDDEAEAGASGHPHGDGDGDGDLPEECEGEDVPTFDEVAAFDKCVMCHSSELSGSDRNNAPDDHNFDTHEGATEHLGHVAEQVEEGAMPPPASGITISAAEREALLLWANCGAPE